MPGLTLSNVGFLGGSFVNYVAPTYVGGYTVGLATTQTTVTIVLTSLSGGTDFAPSIGDLVILAFAQTINNVDPDNDVTLYTELIDVLAQSSLDTNLYVGYKYLTSTDTSITVTNIIASASTASSYALQVWRNAGTPITYVTSAVRSGGPTILLRDAQTTFENSIAVGIAAGSSNASAGYTNPTLTTTISSRGNNPDTGYDSTIGMGYLLTSTPGTIVLGTFIATATAPTNSAVSATMVVPSKPA